MPWIEAMQDVDVRLGKRKFKHLKAGARALLTEEQATAALASGKVRRSGAPTADIRGGEDVAPVAADPDADRS